jgi:hypothetical protein
VSATASASGVQVDVRRASRRFDASAMLELPADVRTVWATITDYPNLPRFMPGIRSCRVLAEHTVSRTTSRLDVEQRGEFRFLMFAQTMTVRLEIEQRALRFAAARAVSFDPGPLKPRLIGTFEGRYELASMSRRRASPRTQLRYSAVIVLRLPPPPGIGSLAVRQNLQLQLEAIAREVERRAENAAA